MSLVFSVGGVLDRPGHFWKLSIDTNTAIESHFLEVGNLGDTVSLQTT